MTYQQLITAETIHAQLTQEAMRVNLPQYQFCDGRLEEISVEQAKRLASRWGK